MDISTTKIFFWKAFVISLVFFIGLVLLVLSGYDYIRETAFHLYHLNPDNFNSVFVYSMAFWKILIFQFTFIPALVLTFMDRKK